MEEFGADLDFLEQGLNGPDNAVRNFYEKLSDLPTPWIPLEEEFYRISKMGNLALGQMTQYFREWPSLDYFYNT